MAYIYYDRSDNRVLSFEEVEKMTSEYKEQILSGQRCPLGLIQDNDSVIIKDGYITSLKTTAQIIDERVNDPDVFVDITNKHAEEQRKRHALAQESIQISNIINEFKDYIAPDVDYEAAFNDSVTPQKNSQKRPGFKRFVTPQAVAALLLTISITVVGFKTVNAFSNMAKNWQDKQAYNTAISQMRESGIDLNTVNNNKVIIEGSRDIDGSPTFYYDTDAIARDILAFGDEGFDCGLYYAYDTMGVFRTMNGNHNWDQVIRKLASKVNAETNPATFNKISGCYSFQEYLLRNGLVDELGNPSEDLFKKQGIEAVKAYYETLENKEGVTR